MRVQYDQATFHKGGYEPKRLHHCGAERRRENNLCERVPSELRGLIAQGVSPFSPEAIAFRAGRLMLAEIQLYARRSVSFGFETTLSGQSYLNMIRHLKKRGYEVHFFFLWVPSVDLALKRVRARVLEGGHDVPENVVRRRFDRSIHNFLLRYIPLGNSWMLFDNSGAMPTVIAFEKQNSLRIIKREIYETLMVHYGKS